MDGFMRLLKQRWLISLIGLLALALLIWFAGPYIAIAGSVPLGSAVVRLVVILVVFMLWGLNNLRLQLKAAKQNNSMIEDIGAAQTDDQSDLQSEQTEEELQLLKTRFSEALDVLKKAKLSGEGKLYELPWYMIIGPPGSGKTTALVNSDLHFPLAEQFGKGAVKGVGGTRNCDWWFTDQAVLIDTAGRYTTQDTHQTADAAAWGGFLDLLRKHRRKRPINGVIVAISVSDLLLQTEYERNANAQAIRRRIQELTEKLGTGFPIYLLLTKADLIAGFLECFDDLGRDEQAQTWGVTFPIEVSNQGENLKSAFEDGFDKLIARLNERILSRLHHERDFSRRGLILTFPQRLANLRPIVGEFIELTFRPSRFENQAILRGVYLTSGTQEGTPVDRLLASVSRTFGIDFQAAAAFAGAGKSYFLTRLFSEVIFPEAEITSGSRKMERIGHWMQIGAYSAAILLTVGAAFGFAVSFTQNDASLQTMHERIIAHNKTPRPHPRATLTQNLPSLNTIRNVSAVFADRDGSSPFFSHLGLYVGDELGANADSAYDRVLEKSMLPAIMTDLENQMRDESHGLSQVYNALTLYLSLPGIADPDKVRLRAWVVDVWQRRYGRDASTRDVLTAHLDFMLTRGFNNPVLSKARIAEAQRIVCRASPAEQILRRIYELMAPLGLVPFKLTAAGGASRRVLTSVSGRSAINTIPGTFTRPGYAAFFRVGVPEIPKMFGQIRRICKLKTKLGLAGLLRLRNQIENLYFREYSQRWQSFTADIGLVKFTDMMHGAQVLNTLSGPRSPLRNLLLAYQRHTALGVDPNAGGAGSAAGVAGGMAERAVSRRTGSAIGGLLASSAKSAVGKIPGASVRRLFAPTRALVAGTANSPAPLEALLNDIRALRDALTGIVNAPTPGEAAIEAARQRFERKGRDMIGRVRSEGERQVQPVRKIMLAAARNSWATILQSSRVHMNRIWREEVLPAYARLEGKFPLAARSEREARLVDFASFFRPNGVLSEFIKTQLQPFVRMRGRWRLHRVDGLTLGIPTQTLGQFQRAQRITKALFPDGSQTPTVRFSLKPRVLDDRANRFTLTMDGQELSYRHGPVMSTTMVWPGPERPGQVRIVFTDRAGRETRQTIDGDWAWFRLLTPGRVRKTNRADRLLVTFGTREINAVYEITTVSLTNPFDATQALFKLKIPKRL